MKMSSGDYLFPASAYTLFYGTLTLFSVFHAKTILKNVVRHVFYTPGVGSVTTNKKIKHKVATVETDAGTLDIPIMKMGSFELQFGFFEKTNFSKLGLHRYSEFMELYSNQFPEHENLKNVGNNWILNYRRPKDFRGHSSVTGFVLSEIDDVIYLFDVTENNLIDYEMIMSMYDTEIENLPSDFGDSTQLSEPDNSNSTQLSEPDNSNSTQLLNLEPNTISNSIQDPPSEMSCDDFTCIQQGGGVNSENTTGTKTAQL